jgi:uncharacterized protein (DUF1499 family)
MRLRRLCLALAVLAMLLLLASGPGVRLGLWPYQTGFLLLRAAVFVGSAAALLSLIGFFLKPFRKAFVLCLALGLVAAAAPLAFQRQARAVPPINDISTALDTAPAIAEQQRRAYPDLRPLILDASREDSYEGALQAVRDMGWEIAAADPAAGRIHAVATTFWFGFKDDVTVRVTAQEGASRIDVRSRSRVGRSDAGTNARRVRAYLKRLQ